MSPELLEEVLVELRPVPEAEWADELDRKVARGFGESVPESARPRKERWWRREWLRPLAVTAACGIVIVTVVALPGSGGDDQVAGGGSVAAPETVVSDTDGGAGSAGATSGEAERPGNVAGDEAAGSTGSVAGPGFSSPTVPGERRRVEYLASITLTAPPERIARVGDEVLRVTDRLGGYVANSSISSSDEGGGGAYELKVPVDKLDDAMAELSKLAHVSSRSQNTQDITGSFRSARSQLREARTERESLLRQLALADTPNETASIRRRLDLVAGQIGNAKAALARVQRRANYATVSVNLTSDADAPGAGDDDDGTWTPGDAIDDAGRILEVAAGVLVIVLAAALPIALVVVLGGLAARAVVRRRRERALDAAA